MIHHIHSLGTTSGRRGRPRRTALRATVAAGAATLLALGLGGSADAAAPRPNLVVTAVKWGPVDPVGGQQVRFSAVVKNTGTVATPAGTIIGVAFEVDGVKRTWSDTTTQPLPPGQSFTRTANYGPTGSATWAATSGTHTVRAVVDDVARIPESREDDNARSAKVPVAAGLSVQVGAGPGLLVGMANLDRPTVLTTSVTGDLYAGCRTADGVIVDGTEQFVATWTLGRNQPAFGQKFNDGADMVAAGVTQHWSWVSSFQVIYSYQGHPPVPCPAGQTAGLTGLHASSATLTRWPGMFGTEGPALAAVTVPLDTVFPFDH